MLRKCLLSEITTKICMYAQNHQAISDNFVIADENNLFIVLDLKAKIIVFIVAVKEILCAVTNKPVTECGSLGVNL